MAWFVDLFSTHALLGWLAIGALLLTVELITGSGWLLWPATSAALVGLIAMVARLELTAQAAMFALFTIASTYVGRRFIKSHDRQGHDPNDPHARLIGRVGKAVAAFPGGVGRVFVDGKEWAAELDGEGSVEAGARVQVIALVGGARLKVRAA